METYLLISCSVDILQLLIKQYELHKIDRQCFYNNARLKLQFIYEHLDCIESQEERQKILEVLNKCNLILF